LTLLIQVADHWMVKQKPASARRSIVTKNLTSGRKEMRVATLNTVHRSRPDQATHEHCYNYSLAMSIDCSYNYRHQSIMPALERMQLQNVAYFDCLPSSVIVFVIVIIVARRARPPAVTNPQTGPITIHCVDPSTPTPMNFSVTIPFPWTFSFLPVP